MSEGQFAWSWMITCVVVFTALAVGATLFYEASGALVVSELLPVIVLLLVQIFQDRALRVAFLRSRAHEGDVRMGKVLVISMLKLPILVLVLGVGAYFFSLPPLGFLIGVSIFYASLIVTYMRMAFRQDVASSHSEVAG